MSHDQSRPAPADHTGFLAATGLEDQRQPAGASGAVSYALPHGAETEGFVAVADHRAAATACQATFSRGENDGAQLVLETGGAAYAALSSLSADAPERVWLDPTGMSEGWTGLREQVFEGDVEYTRADLAHPAPVEAELALDAARYRWLRARHLETIAMGGVFAGMTPDNVVLSFEDLDAAVDAARAQSARPASLPQTNREGA